MKKFSAILLILWVTLASLVPQENLIADQKEEKVSFLAKPPKLPCYQVLKQIGAAALKTTALLGTGVFLMTQGASKIGDLSGSPYLGLSIYLDYPVILSFLTPQEQEVLEAPHKDIEHIVKIVSKHLSLKNSDQFDPLPYLRPSMASSYFSAHPPQANMCRHKALILQGILSHLGIKSEIVTGTIAADSGGRGDHVWVYVPEINKSVDPMNNIIESPEEYKKDLKAEINYGVIHWAKPAGIIGR
jgi:hypothetical protein